MRKEELKKIKEDLLRKKADIEQLVKKKKLESISESEVGDQIDLATDSQIKELDYSLQDNEIDTLNKIEETLEKVNKNTYGICEICKKEIPIERLKALPFSAYCIKCQKEVDQDYRKNK